MSGELIATLVTAGIGAAASVISAMIQARGKGRDDGDREGPAPPRRGLTARITRQIDFGEAATGKRGVDGVWLAVVIVIPVEAVALATRSPGASAALNCVIVIPAVTVVLALARPVGWGYAAGAVTLLHAVVVGAAAVLSEGRLGSSPQIFFLSFLANALIVGGVAYLRTRARPPAVGAVFVVCGAAALAWLFVPMVIPMVTVPRGPEPERFPEEVEIEPGRPRPPHVRRLPVHVRRVEPRVKIHPASRSFGRDFNLRFSPKVRLDVEGVRERESPER